MINHEGRRLDDQARRAARRLGLKARKSRWRYGSIDNQGEFQIIDPDRNWIVAGEKFNLTAQEVIRLCEEWEKEDQQSEKPVKIGA